MDLTLDTMVLRQQWDVTTMVGLPGMQSNFKVSKLIIGANVEMEPLAPNGSSFGRLHDANAILNECKRIDLKIIDIENDLEELKILQQRSLDDPDSSAQSSTNRQLDEMSSKIMTSYQNLVGDVRAIKQQPDSGNPRNALQVGKVDRTLKGAIHQYRNVESDFRARLRDQIARQYRIVNPNASQAEVERVVSDPGGQQIFSQALMQSDRRGQSRAALSAVEDRHAAIQKIESQMTQLAQLFNEMEALVVQQEAAVTVIEQKGEEVVDNIQGGNEHLVKGVKSAQARNRKKWWCLLICGMSTYSFTIRNFANFASYYHHYCRHHRGHLCQSH